MPLIEVKVIEGVFSPEQKADIAERLTDAMVSIEGENLRPVTWCVIEEVASGAWAIGGRCLTTEAVHALAQDGGLALGAQAGEARLREVASAAGFSCFRRATETPFNLVLEARP